MWHSNGQPTAHTMDSLYENLMTECKHSAPGARLTYSLRSRLEKHKPEHLKQLVSRTRDGCAPLFIVCKRGNAEMAEYLIRVCHADIEQRGLYEVLEDRSVHCVTPLWCAAVSGKLPVVKCLISHGADVNAVSDSGSTPVRSACFMTHLDIVSYLVNNGADIQKANFNGGTCLINSVQSVELCTFLLEHGANVNAADIQNKTALHYAIQEHRYESMKLLLDYNADPHMKSRYNDDALQTACLKGAAQIFDYLINKIEYPPDRLADAYELIGSTFFDEHSNRHLALKYWQAALTLRSIAGVDGNPLPKRPVCPPRDCFKNMVEFSTLEELNAVMLDADSVRMQSLLICERVLGPSHKDTLFRLMFRGAAYADALRYQCCIDLWTRALEIRIEKDTILWHDTCFTAQALVRLMIDLQEKGVEPNRMREKPEQRFRDVVTIFKLLTKQLTEARQLLEYRPVLKRQGDSFDRMLKCITHLIYLLIKTAQTDEERLEMRRLVHGLVKENPRSSSTEDTLLHLCVSYLNTIHSSYFADDVQKIFPNLEVVKLLLECGARVNARNESRSTPLHIASNVYNFQNPLVELLLKHHAHMDVPNRNGMTPARLISTNAQNKIQLIKYMSLQCYAAQAIVKYNIDYRELPASLQNFLDFHKE